MIDGPPSKKNSLSEESALRTVIQTPMIYGELGTDNSLKIFKLFVDHHSLFPFPPCPCFLCFLCKSAGEFNAVHDFQSWPL